MQSDIFTNTFKTGSRTYYYSSLFFPKDVRDDVFTLYSFVRTADNFVDAIPQQKDDFYAFGKTYREAIRGKQTDNEIITAFVELTKRKKFDVQWIDAFLKTMGSDVTKKSYNTLAELEIYMYGSAEVIGLMMAAIMQLPKDAYPAAKKLGKAMQFINFLRDIQEDLHLGRTYLPMNELKKTGLQSLSYKDVAENKEAFNAFMNTQIQRYEIWQQEAEQGFNYIPIRYRIPIKTASDMYKYTAQQIRKNPYIIYRKKVKPSVFQICTTGIKNSFLSL